MASGASGTTVRTALDGREKRQAHPLRKLWRDERGSVSGGRVRRGCVVGGHRVGAVGRVDRLEPTVFHHGKQDAGVEQLGFADEAVDERLGGGLGLLLHKGDHGDVALDLDVFAQVEALGGRVDAELRDLARLAGLVAGDAPRVAQVDVHGRVDVRLQAPGHVVEAAAEGDAAGAQPAHARHELDALFNLVPGRVVLFRFGVAGRLDRLVARHQRVQRDDLAVAVQNLNGELAGDVGGDGRDVCVRFLFAHHLRKGYCGCVMSERLLLRRKGRGRGRWR